MKTREPETPSTRLPKRRHIANLPPPLRAIEDPNVAPSRPPPVQGLYEAGAPVAKIHDDARRRSRTSSPLSPSADLRTWRSGVVEDTEVAAPVFGYHVGPVLDKTPPPTEPLIFSNFEVGELTKLFDTVRGGAVDMSVNFCDSENDLDGLMDMSVFSAYAATSSNAAYTEGIINDGPHDGLLGGVLEAAGPSVDPYVLHSGHNVPRSFPPAFVHDGHHPSLLEVTGDEMSAAMALHGINNSGGAGPQATGRQPASSSAGPPNGHDMQATMQSAAQQQQQQQQQNQRHHHHQQNGHHHRHHPQPPALRTSHLPMGHHQYPHAHANSPQMQSESPAYTHAPQPAFHTAPPTQRPSLSTRLPQGQHQSIEEFRQQVSNMSHVAAASGMHSSLSGPPAAGGEGGAVWGHEAHWGALRPMASPQIPPPQQQQQQQQQLQQQHHQKHARAMSMATPQAPPQLQDYSVPAPHGHSRHRSMGNFDGGYSAMPGLVENPPAAATNMPYFQLQEVKTPNLSELENDYWQLGGPGGNGGASAAHPLIPPRATAHTDARVGYGRRGSSHHSSSAQGVGFLTQPESPLGSLQAGSSGSLDGATAESAHGHVGGQKRPGSHGSMHSPPKPPSSGSPNGIKTKSVPRATPKGTTAPTTISGRLVKGPKVTRASLQQLDGGHSKRKTLTEEQRRENHNRSEKRRRHIIDGGFGGMQLLLPENMHKSASKATQLRNGADMVARLQQQAMQLDALIWQVDGGAVAGASAQWLGGGGGMAGSAEGDGDGDDDNDDDDDGDDDDA